MAPSKQNLVERAAAALAGRDLLRDHVDPQPSSVRIAVARREPMPRPVVADRTAEPTARPNMAEPVSSQSAVHPQSEAVTINFDRLERRGFLRPDKSTSRIAEEFRLIKRALLLRAFGFQAPSAGRGNVFMVTSAKPREGKTFVAINLAISIAMERDVHVLLIDADVVRPALMRDLGVPSGPGITDLLADPKLDVSNVLVRTNIEKLSLISAGTFNPMATELLASDRMHALVDELATRYPDRVIIFDSPPLLATSEPSTLAHHIGQILFVVEAEKTNEATVRAALDLMGERGNVSLVLNKTGSFMRSQSFGSYYGYYGKDRR